jgi:hypothetical protein
MNGPWYYSHDGVTHGPFSTAEIKDRAIRQLLLDTDLLWQGGPVPTDPLPAQAALDFSKLQPAPSTVPEWLADMAKVAADDTAQAPVVSKEAPSWLEDMRLWVGLEVVSDGKPPTITPADKIVTQGTPDWLTGWIPEEPAKVPKPEQTKQTVKIQDVLADTTIQETGFDLKTGQILDPEKFRKWQKSANSQQPSVSNESLFEVFRKARIAIENWIDDDSRRPLIMSGDLQAIKRDATLQALFQKSQGYGAAMEQKLWRHLEFMVENRRKYYAACSA